MRGGGIFTVKLRPDVTYSNCLHSQKEGGQVLQNEALRWEIEGEKVSIVWEYLFQVTPGQDFQGVKVFCYTCQKLINAKISNQVIVNVTFHLSVIKVYTSLINMYATFKTYEPRSWPSIEASVKVTVIHCQYLSSLRAPVQCYRSGMVNSKSFIGKVLLQIKWKFELTVNFKHDIIGKHFTEMSQNFE